MELDAIDHEIVRLLREDARRSVADIAQQVTLSPTAVKRRIDRLETTGVILGYTARVDHRKLGATMSAFVELRFAGKTTPEAMDQATAQLPEVRAVYTTAGDQDAIALVRAADVDHLRDVIHHLRAATSVIGTRTHVILDERSRDDWRSAS